MSFLSNILRRRSDAHIDDGYAYEANSLSAHNITVIVRGNVIVNDVSLGCNTGAVVGIIGPNGAGKTTLIKAMAGLTRPTHGRVTVNGRTVQDISPSELARTIAYVPQSAAVHAFTAIDLVLMGRYPYLRRFQLEATEDREAAYDALAETETADLAHRRIDTLSGGERQRVILARALAQDSSIILADEPVASLDIRHQLLTMQILRDRARQHNAAVCVVMHDLNLAAKYCDSLLAMHRGKSIASGTPAEVLTTDLINNVFQVNANVQHDHNSIPHVRVESA